ncbi:MAG: hypothetical protein ACXITR_04330, partial [Cyanobacterium sp.]
QWLDIGIGCLLVYTPELSFCFREFLMLLSIAQNILFVLSYWKSQGLAVPRFIYWFAYISRLFLWVFFSGEIKRESCSHI